ncbi:MAG: CRISPR-associated endonuclease Cas2 [Caldilineaceae bacterium]|nr:CRISPR-associated endonuclease Cas2 [Caldilineaceae bacterium]
MFVLVSYDVADDRRRGKIARALQDFGGERVQYSVFECYLTARNRARLQERLANVIHPDEDSIRIYRLCDQCRGDALLLGCAQPVEEPALRII